MMATQMMHEKIRTLKPRRSLLYVPGNNARALEKAATLPTDVVIFDLADSIAPESKLEARQMVYDALRKYDYGYREKVVRINSQYSDWGKDDLRVFSTARVDAILQPKIEHGKEVQQVAQFMSSFNAPYELPIWCMLETPMGILNAHEITAANYRVQALLVGTNDLAKGLQIRLDNPRPALVEHLMHVVLVARSYNLEVFDGVFTDLEDLQGLEDECFQAASLGFDGKALMHPNQIGTANRIFSPTTQEVDWSKEVIEKYTQARAQHKGIAVIRGKLIEELHFDKAQRIIKLSEEVEKRDELQKPSNNEEPKKEQNS